MTVVRVVNIRPPLSANFPLAGISDKVADQIFGDVLEKQMYRESPKETDFQEEVRV